MTNWILLVLLVVSLLIHAAQYLYVRRVRLELSSYKQAWRTMGEIFPGPDAATRKQMMHEVTRRAFANGR